MLSLRPCWLGRSWSQPQLCDPKIFRYHLHLAFHLSHCFRTWSVKYFCKVLFPSLSHLVSRKFHVLQTYIFPRSEASRVNMHYWVWLSQSDYSVFISEILRKVDSNTELPWAVDVMMARANTIFNLISKVNEWLSFFVALFSKRNRKHVLRVSIGLQEHSWKFGRIRKSWSNTRLRLVFLQYFSFFQTSTRVSITRYKQGTCFLYFFNQSLGMSRVKQAKT